MKVCWRTTGGLRLLASELSRGSTRDLAEAGRELGRFDIVSGLVTALRTVSLAGRLTAVDRPA